MTGTKQLGRIIFASTLNKSTGHDLHLWDFWESFFARYDSNLGQARAFGLRKGTLNGATTGVVYLVMFGTYGLAFWYGSKLIVEEDYTAGDMLTVGDTA